VVRRSSGIPVRSATLIQISGTSTPSRSRQAIFTMGLAMLGQRSAPRPLPTDGFYHIGGCAPARSEGSAPTSPIHG
jgi:hypothetical protein